MGTGFWPQALLGGSLDVTSHGLEYRTPFPLHVKKTVSKSGVTHK